MREPCCSVGFTGTPGDGEHIRASAMYTFTWLPKGYGPSMEDRGAVQDSTEDRMVCVLFDPDGRLESKPSKGERHPLVEAIATAIEGHLKDHPEDAVGWFENRP